MAEAEKTKKTRKPQGPRTPKPHFAIVSYRDESGNPVRLRKSDLSITIVNDASKLVDIMEDPDSLQTVTRVSMPVAAKADAAS